MEKTCNLELFISYISVIYHFARIIMNETVHHTKDTTWTRCPRDEFFGGLPVNRDTWRHSCNGSSMTRMASHETESVEHEAYEKPGESETSSKKSWKSKGKMCSVINCYNYQQTCDLPFFGFPKDPAR